MKKSPVWKTVGMVSWFVTGLAALNVGLAPFNIDFFSTGFMAESPGLGLAVRYVVLAAAVASLVMLVFACSDCSKESCGSCSGPRSSSSSH